jgi:hypothetical protein
MKRSVYTVSCGSFALEIERKEAGSASAFDERVSARAPRRAADALLLCLRRHLRALRLRGRYLSDTSSSIIQNSIVYMLEQNTIFRMRHAHGRFRDRLERAPPAAHSPSFSFRLRCSITMVSTICVSYIPELHSSIESSADLAFSGTKEQDVPCITSQPGRLGSGPCKRQKLLRKLPAGLWSILRPKKLARSPNILLGFHASRVLVGTT